MEETILQPGTSQFAKIEYLLQLSLNACTARILKATHISNPHLTMQFEKRSKGLLTLDSWVDCSVANGISNEESNSVASSGFHIPSPGMIFPVGQIKTNSFEPDRPGSTKAVKRMILCQVAVGRAFACNSKEINLEIPNGYDSFYLQDRDEESSYYCEYAIKDGAQVLPLYTVTFEYDPVVEHKSRERPICDNCERHVATVHCDADNANLCQDCDANLHMANKVAQRHIRVPIGKSGAETLGSCRIHAYQKIEFFCSQCCVPVCVHCKMVGHHSTGEAAKHVLVSVVEALDVVFKESRTKDGIIQQRIQNIQNQISKLNQRTVQINDQEKRLEAELYALYQQALLSLKSKADHKKVVLLSDELELKRQLHEIEQASSFLDYQQSGSDAFHLLFNWSKHQSLMQGLRDFMYFREDIDVYPNMKISGNVTILEDEKSNFPSPVKTKPVMASPSSVVSQGLNGVRGLPMKVARNPIRRTSDFFAETLNALEGISLDQTLKVNEINETEYRFNFQEEDC